MPTDTNVTTVRLPHTGLHVPDRSLTITAFKSLATSDGYAFTGNLRRNNKQIGTIENHGTGGMTFFHPVDFRAFGERELNEYAAQCRTEEGGPVTAELLLDDLIEELLYEREIKKLGKQGRTLLRLMDNTYPNSGPYSFTQMGARMPGTDAHWKELARQVAARPDTKPRAKQWWQAWNGTGWIDLTTRPAGVSAELYG